MLAMAYGKSKGMAVLSREWRCTIAINFAAFQQKEFFSTSKASDRLRQPYGSQNGDISATANPVGIRQRPQVSFVV
jgi:hypothetical protein